MFFTSDGLVGLTHINAQTCFAVFLGNDYYRADPWGGTVNLFDYVEVFEAL